MKIIISIIIAFAFAFYGVSCKKKTIIPTLSNASAIINGSNWTVNFIRAGETDSTIGFMAQIQKLNEFNDAYPYESLSLEFYKNREKQILRAGYSVIPSAKFYTIIEQGHASNEGFDVLESDTVNNWVEITKESGDYKTIKGKFSLTLIKTSTGIDPNRYPDTLYIRDGVFGVTLD